MHDWEGIILWGIVSLTWFVWVVHEKLDIYMCVWSQIWHEQQWTLMVGKPVAWCWYERKHFTHDW